MQIKNPDINQLVDKRSENIWNQINNHFKITLQFHDARNYMAYSLKDNVTFYISKNNYNKDFFAHELLHVYLGMKNINIGGYLIARFRENLLLTNVFSSSLLDHISNTLDHIKIFQIYLNLGFDRTQFILDYAETKCTDREIKTITQLINSKSNSWKQAADLYVGKYFAIKACPNNSIDYTNFLSQLNEINPTLFQNLEIFWNKWLEYDIDKYDIRNYNYWDMSDELYDSLVDWIITKL